MTPTDHAMLALGVLSLCVFAFAGGFAVMVMIDELIPNLERITAILFPRHNAASADTSPAGSPLDAAEAGVAPTVEAPSHG